MNIRFDSLNRFEIPKITVCNPGSMYVDGCVTKTVGILVGTEAEELMLNFNAPSEFNFRVSELQDDDKNASEYLSKMYKSIQNKRLLFVDDIGYFVISSVISNIENGVKFKDVSARSIDAELEARKVPYIENGTYKLYSVDDSSGIANKIADNLPMWRIGYVADSIASKYRTIEDVDLDQNCLSFFLEKIQDAYECIVKFDTTNRVIRIYDQESCVKHTDIHITDRDIINSISISENGDELYTALSVVGGDNITISAINPIGTNTIYNFSYYLGWMSEDLRRKVKMWQYAVKSSQDEYYRLNSAYYTGLSTSNDLQMEIDRLNIQKTMYLRCRDNIVAEADTVSVEPYNEAIIEAGGEPIRVCEEIADTISEIDRLVSECQSKIEKETLKLTSVNEYIESGKKEISKIQNSLSMNSYFSKDELDELMCYIYEGSYNDEFVVITDIMKYTEQFEQMKLMYDRAVATLEKRSTPTQEFSVDVESFIFEKEFLPWSNQLETGCLIQIDLEEGDMASLFLSAITVNYSEKNMSLTFGNRLNKFDIKSLFETTLGQISRSANSIGYLKDTVSPIKNGEIDEMKNALQSSKDLTMASALSSKNEQFVIDGCGITGRRMVSEGKYDPKQVKVTSRSIVFTDDAWQTCTAAIGEFEVGDGETTYGLNAKAIVGEMILGNNLKIYDNDGNDLFTIMDGMVSSQVGDVEGRLTLLEQNDTSINIRVQTLEEAGSEIDSITTSTGYTFDENGLGIRKDGEEIQNVLDNTGMFVTRDETEILSASEEGVDAINLVARDYLCVGSNCRFEDYTNSDGEKRTACFFIG